MITVYHGDNFVASREALNQDLKQAVKFTAKNLKPEDLAQALASSSLFKDNDPVIIYSLFSLPQSKSKDQLFHCLNSNANQPICLWENKTVSSAQLKKLHQVRSKLFKTSKNLFKFLNSFKPGNSKASLLLLHQTIDQDPLELVFYLLVIRLSQLIQIKDGSQVNLSNWQYQQLKNQARAFSFNQLIKLHQQLISIDYQIKTGQTDLPLISQLDLLIASL